MDQRFVIANNLNMPGVKAIFTTRVDGDRNNPLRGFNLSFTEGFEEEVTIKNRSHVASLFEVSLNSFILPVQRHTDKVCIIIDPTTQSPIEADAVITSMKGIVLGVLVADCVPILVYDPEAGIVGAIHAGWRGTSSGIIKKSLSLMKKEFNTSLSKTRISIGPSIKWCCYEVGHDVLNAIEKETGNITEYSRGKGNGKYCVDLATANRLQAESLGIRNIWISEECTSCYPEKYYSYRYYNGLTGRQGGFIGMV